MKKLWARKGKLRNWMAGSRTVGDMEAEVESNNPRVDRNDIPQKRMEQQEGQTSNNGYYKGQYGNPTAAVERDVIGRPASLALCPGDGRKVDGARGCRSPEWIRRNRRGC